MLNTKFQSIVGLIVLCFCALSFPSHADENLANKTQTTFPSFELAQPEIYKLNAQIVAINVRYEKELSDSSKLVELLYADKLNALKNENRINGESAADFKARQEKERDQIIDEKNIELTTLTTSLSLDSETVPLKARIKILTEHLFIVGTEGIETELSSYDADKHQFTIKLHSKLSALKLKLKDTIPLPANEAQLFLKQWETGLIKPEAKAKINGDVVEVVLLNDADHSRWVELKSTFYSLGTLSVLPSNTLNTLFQSGRLFKDCLSCPDMIVLPAGSFDMGSKNGSIDEKPVHHVTLNHPFAMSKTEVTQGEWKSVMGNAPSYFKNCGENCPIEQVSWEDAKAFIQKLNIKTGRQYRLPSEAEWEYACRAGVKQNYCGGDTVDDVAWYSKNSGELPHSTAQKQANAWGLNDMSGNVWEWVEDNYHADYIGAPNDGTAWQGDSDQHVLRGGSWNLIPELVRATVRSAGAPVLKDYYYGFRLVRTMF
jgi:formylglycine-generating enzyme required for sulfatase activity